MCVCVCRCTPARASRVCVCVCKARSASHHQGQLCVCVCQAPISQVWLCARELSPLGQGHCIHLEFCRMQCDYRAQCEQPRHKHGLRVAVSPHWLTHWSPSTPPSLLLRNRRHTSRCLWESSRETSCGAVALLCVYLWLFSLVLSAYF